MGTRPHAYVRVMTNDNSAADIIRFHMEKALRV